jgi:hypothetical protein
MNLEVRLACIENRPSVALQSTLRIELTAIWALNVPM